MLERFYFSLILNSFKKAVENKALLSFVQWHIICQTGFPMEFEVGFYLHGIYQRNENFSANAIDFINKFTWMSSKKTGNPKIRLGYIVM